MSEYYVYHHIRTDKNIPFYVGKGKGQRYNTTHPDLRSKYWHYIYNKCKGNIKMEKIHTNLTEDQALQLENQIYNQYLNKGYKLVNLAQPGIKGSTGHKKSPEWKRKYSKIMSKINKGRTLTPQHKANLSKSLKGRDNSSYNKKVKQYTKDGKFIKEFGSVKEAMYIIGITYPKGSGISACALGKQKSAYGYVWKY